MEILVGGGGEVLVPRVEEAVIEPRVMRTMSEGWTWIIPVAPAVETTWISETVIVETGAKETEFTFVSRICC